MKKRAALFLCTDDKHVDDLLSEGSVNHQVKMAIKAGLDPFLAYQLASLNAAECYGLETKGAVAPGFDADLLFISDVRESRRHEDHGRRPDRCRERTHGL